jgi:ABC-type bacteriocin/lantibiotic exporter with double-glycine peptidase domain
MNLTRVLIAHRRETIATADRVLYLDQSGLVLPQEDVRAQAADARAVTQLSAQPARR